MQTNHIPRQRANGSAIALDLSDPINANVQDSQPEPKFCPVCASQIVSHPHLDANWKEIGGVAVHTLCAATYRRIMRVAITESKTAPTDPLTHYCYTCQEGFVAFYGEEVNETHIEHAFAPLDAPADPRTAARHSDNDIAPLLDALGQLSTEYQAVVKQAHVRFMHGKQSVKNCGWTSCESATLLIEKVNTALAAFTN